MLNESYQNGVAHALGELEKMGGEEFAEKVAKKVSPGMYDSAVKAGKKYFKGMKSDAKGAMDKRKSTANRLKAGGMAALKASPAAAVAGGVGYGGYKALED